MVQPLLRVVLGSVGSCPLHCCELGPGTSSSELPATRKRTPNPTALDDKQQGSQCPLMVLQAPEHTSYLPPPLPTPSPCCLSGVLLALLLLEWWEMELC